MNAEIRSWEAGNKYLGEKLDRPVANNTRIHRLCNGDIGIVLHATYVVTYCFNGPVILNSGGWKTATTKERINRFAPSCINLYQTGGQWYVSINGVKHAYCDNMKIDKDGRILFGSTADYQKTRRINKLLDKYIEKMLKLPELPFPEDGDCFVCRFAGSDSGCLEAHLEEKYVHGSLIWNAIAARGYGSPELVMQVRARSWNDKGKPSSKVHVARDVRRFFRTKLGLVR
jgi:hypothetical protein